MKTPGVVWIVIFVAIKRLNAARHDYTRMHRRQTPATQLQKHNSKHIIQVLLCKGNILSILFLLLSHSLIYLIHMRSASTMFCSRYLGIWYTRRHCSYFHQFNIRNVRKNDGRCRYEMDLWKSEQYSLPQLRYIRKYKRREENQRTHNKMTSTKKQNESLSIAATTTAVSKRQKMRGSERYK